MDKKQEEFLKKLLEDFKVEAAEHYRAIVNGLIELEKGPPPEQYHEFVEAAFREAHSLKGAARAVNLAQVERLCGNVENVFSGLKRDEIVPAPALFDALHAALDILDALLAKPGQESATAGSKQVTEIVKVLDSIVKGGQTASPPVASRVPETASHDDTVRLSTVKLGSLLLQIEELITAKLSAREAVNELRGVRSRLAAWKKARNGITCPRPYQDSVDAPAPEEELLERNDFFASLDYDLNILARRMDQDSRAFARTVDGLMEDMKKALMLPFSSALDLIPKVVRDLAHDGGKEADLTIRGGEIEVDRRILEEIKDPLIHLVRNCIDYGIETPGIRAGKKKPPRGVVTITVTQKDSRRIEIVLADDGAGVDTPAVVDAAVKAGVLTAEAAEKLSAEEKENLIFQSGVSTSSIITDLSGRGLGLAIVQEKVEKLGGTVRVETRPDRGTMFHIVLPLMLASFRGVAVRAGGQTFLLPLKNVERVTRVRREDVKTVENMDTIELNGQVIGLTRLCDALGLPSPKATGVRDEFMPVLVLSYTRQRMAFTVEEVIGEQEGLIKSLGPQLVRVRNFAGATISGGGKIMPILDVGDLMESASRGETATAPSGMIPELAESPRTILVAEDSITARALLKNILESAGYAVKTAVDGLDAFTSLRGGEFDLLVSDVDMPRMNGFDLTIRIRSDSRLADLPVVLVTALESREDRERGVDAGANAYIVKSGFDQTGLLDVIRRLIGKESAETQRRPRW